MDRLVFEREWARCEPRVKAFLSAGCRDGTLVDDLSQEVAAAAWGKRHEYEEDREFLNWAVGMARFVLLRYRRDTARQRVILAPDLIDRVAELLLGQSDELDRKMRALSHCREKLGRPARQLLALRYSEDLPLADVARRLGRSHGAVRTSISRVRDALRTCIETWLKGEATPASIREAL